MTTYRKCGDVATIYMDVHGDPLPEPLCSDCWFHQLTMHEMHLPEQVFDDHCDALFPRQRSSSRGPGAWGDAHPHTETTRR